MIAFAIYTQTHIYKQKLATPESALGIHTEGTTPVTDYPNDTQALSHTKLLSNCYLGVGHLVIRDGNMNTDNYARTLVEYLLDTLKNIFGDRNRVSTWQCSGPHGASNCRMVGAAGHIHHFNDLDIIEQVWDSMGIKIVRVMHVARNDLIRALHNSWLNIRVPYLHNLYNSLPRSVRAVIRGRGYPTKYQLTKYIRKKDTIWICLTFPDRDILFAANYSEKK